eukprot:3775602-Alexandrium_andersonii.AAC.1
MPRLARTWPDLRNRLRSVLNNDGEDAGKVGPRPREDVEQVAGDDVVHHHELSKGGLARLDLFCTRSVCRSADTPWTNAWKPGDNATASRP